MLIGEPYVHKFRRFWAFWAYFGDLGIDFDHFKPTSGMRAWILGLFRGSDPRFRTGWAYFRDLGLIWHGFRPLWAYFGGMRLDWAYFWNLVLSFLDFGLISMGPGQLVNGKFPTSFKGTTRVCHW